jgi:hypothetical protein
VSDQPDNIPAKNVRRLTDALRRVRTAEAERSDIVVELRDAERARLEILAEELKSVFEEVPAENETFLFTVAEGTPPRLWIDMTSFVVMGRDRRVYRFLKDTRIGRTVILETADIADMADCVTNYIAERIIERDRAVEADWLVKRVMQGEAPAPKKSARQLLTMPAALKESGNVGWVVAAFLFGILFGVIALLGSAWFSVS